MAETSSSSSAGMGFAGWLTLIFIVLKINPGSHLDSPVEDWSWWLVLSPILISIGIVLVILGGIGVGFLAAYVVDKRNAKKRRAAFAARFPNRVPPKR